MCKYNNRIMINVISKIDFYVNVDIPTKILSDRFSKKWLYLDKIS